jgi:hypothetical protein
MVHGARTVRRSVSSRYWSFPVTLTGWPIPAWSSSATIGRHGAYPAMQGAAGSGRVPVPAQVSGMRTACLYASK